jgi:acetyl esterase
VGRPGIAERIRQKVGATVVDGFFKTASAIGRLHPMSNPERHEIDVVRDVAYVDDGVPEHRLDVYRPRGIDGPMPVVLYVHGGAFRILSKDTHWIMGLAFARRGFLVLNISYRLAPKHPFPAAIEDACAAYEFAVREAVRWGGDPTTLVLAGESAGANLVSSLAIAATYERPEPFARAVFDTGVVPRAVLPACGILQVTDPLRFREMYSGKLSPFLLDRIIESSDAYLPALDDADGALDLANPLLVFERGDRPVRTVPPFFAICGTADPLLDDTRRLAAAMGRMGCRCEARYYERELHAFHAFVVRRAARRAWRDTFTFLEATLDRPLPETGKTPWDR